MGRWSDWELSHGDGCLTHFALGAQFYNDQWRDIFTNQPYQFPSNLPVQEESPEWTSKKWPKHFLQMKICYTKKSGKFSDEVESMFALMSPGEQNSILDYFCHKPVFTDEPSSQTQGIFLSAKTSPKIA